MNKNSCYFVSVAAFLLLISAVLVPISTAASDELPSRIDFSASAQGEVGAAIGTLPGSLNVFYVGTGAFDLSGFTYARQYFLNSSFSYYLPNTNFTAGISTQGNVNAQWTNQSISLFLYSKNGTDGFFVHNDNPQNGTTYNDVFTVGCGTEGPIQPYATASLAYNGSYVDSSGNRTIYGDAAVYAAPTGPVGSETMCFAVMLLNPDGTPLMTLTWVPEDYVLSDGSGGSITLHAADTFEDSVELSAVPNEALRFSALAEGECFVCIDSFIGGPLNGPTYIADGSLRVDGTANTALYNSALDSSDPYPIYLTYDGARAQGSLSAVWSNQSIDVSITTSEDGAVGFFLDDGERSDYFFAGGIPGGPMDPDWLYLTYQGTYTNLTGTYAVSGKLVVVCIPMGGPTDMFIGAVLFKTNAGIDPLLSIIWAPNDFPLSAETESTVLHAANTFQHSVELESAITHTPTVVATASPSPSPAPTTTPSPTPTVENSRVPPSPETVAVVGVAAALTTSAVAAVPQISSVVISKLTLPGSLTDFLKAYISKAIERADKKKLKLENKTQLITLAELGALAVSILIMTIVVTFVKSGGASNFLQSSVLELLFLTFISVCIMKGVTLFSEAFCCKTCGIHKELSLWWIGSATFFITGVIFLFPFSSPTITRYQEGIPKKTKALLSFSKTLMILTLILPFGLMAASSVSFLATIGDAGLLTVLTTVCYSFLPLPLLPGRAIFSYNRLLAIAAVVPMLVLLYGFTMQILPYWAFAVAGLISIVLTAASIIKLRSSTLPKKTINDESPKNP